MVVSRLSCPTISCTVPEDSCSKQARCRIVAHAVGIYLGDTRFSRPCGHLYGEGLLCQAEEALIAGHFTGETGQFASDW